MNTHVTPEPIPAATREDLYYAVHKGIRLANARMLVALGQADAADEASIADALARLEAHLAMSLSHLEHENRAIHARVEERVPGGSDHAGDDHDHHLDAFGDLRRLAADVAAAGVDRAPKLRRLYQRFALFVAEDLRHMHEEETELMPLIERSFSPEEIHGIEHDIVSNIPPQKMVAFMKVMLGAASRSERSGMVTGMSQAMPEEVFDGVLSAVVGRPWRFGDWDALEAAVC